MADLISKLENLRIAFKEIKVVPSHGKGFKCKHSFGVFLKKLRHDIKPHLFMPIPHLIPMGEGLFCKTTLVNFYFNLLRDICVPHRHCLMAGSQITVGKEPGLKQYSSTFREEIKKGSVHLHNKII